MADERIKVPVSAETRALLQATMNAIEPKLPASCFTRAALPIGLAIHKAMDETMGTRGYFPHVAWEDIEPDVLALVRKLIRRRDKRSRRSTPAR